MAHVKRLALSMLLATSLRAQMTSNDVATVTAQAATRAADVSTNSVIAVVDREGFVLGVWTLGNTNALDVEDAITKAGTAAFLSSDQHAFTSRTAGFIVQQHFPPTVANKPTGPLVGVNFSNQSFSDVNRFKNPNVGLSPDMTSGTNGAAIGPVAAVSGLAGSPGGVPLFKDNRLVGGVAVAGTTRCGTLTLPPPLICIPALADIQQRSSAQPDLDEDVALAGQIGFTPAKKFRGSHVFIDGIRVAYVASRPPKLASVAPLGSIGVGLAEFPITNSPAVSYPKLNLAGMEGEVRAPIIDDPAGNLTASDITNIFLVAADRAAITRAGIRLPRGQPAQVFISVVNNPNSDGVAPVILGTFRTRGATLFSWDVSVQKARTALYFSSALATNFFPAGLPVGRAYSARAVGFLAQSLYPPGIVHTQPGPLYGLQEFFSLVPAGISNPLNNAVLTNALATPDPNLPNGITIFPGGFPLYRNGVLIGAIGISGDGIDQDDIIGASGAALFPPPPAMRSDQIIFRGARLPYAKFPRNPNL
jgi:uncharacterized protein GlcG (DUF336 family)